MSEPRSSGLFVPAVALFAIAVAFLPVWDASQHPARLIVGSLVTAGLVFAFVRTPDWRRWIAFVLSVLFISVYAGITGGAMLLDRSRQVDQLPPCASGVREPDASCVLATEQRAKHREASPGGDLEDGFRQTIIRYNSDETRLMLAPMGALFLVAFAGVLLAKATATRLP